MDLKDYLRVIRRRWFEFILVFTVIIVMYMFVSRMERKEFVATSVVQVGAKGYDDSAKNKQTFLRNHADLMALLRGNETMHNDASRDVYRKMAEVATIELRPEDPNEGIPSRRQQVSDWIEQRQRDGVGNPEDFYEVRPKSLIADDDLEDMPHRYRYENVMDLLEAHDYLIRDLEIKKLDVNEESLRSQIAFYLGQVRVSEGEKVISSIQLSINTFNEALSRLVVNEMAHFSKGVYNELNNERVKEEAGKIDRWYDKPIAQDRIERLYNGLYALYKDLKAAQYRDDQQDIETLENQYVEEFRPLLEEERIDASVTTIYEAFKVDVMRELGMELAEVTARYNNLKTWGSEGNATSVIFNETQISDEIQQLMSRKGAHQEAIDRLEEELEILDIREYELEPAEMELFRTTNERFTLIDEQIDRERIALEELKSRYTSQHPKVLETAQNIEQLESLRVKLEDRLGQTQQAQITYQRLEKRKMIQYNEEKIRSIEMQLEDARSEMDKINDLSLHIEDVKEQRQKVRERINDQKRRLDILKAQLGEEGIVDVNEFARQSVAAPMRYTSNTTVLTVVVGLIVSIFVVYILEYMDTSIKTEHDVRRHMNLPVLSMIGKANKEVILTELPSKDPFAEHFNTAATLVRSAAQDLGLRSFLVTSTVPQEGKTTICVDLAIALARKGLDVIIVDGDLRIPTIHEVLDVANTNGLSNILEGRTGSDDFGDIEKSLLPTTIDNLRVLPSGPIPADPINLLESARMKALIEELKDKCDYLILDTPPIYNVGDTLTMASLVDATLFVVGAERVEQEQVTWAKHLLSNVNANILGVFLNMVRVPGKSYYYYYNGYKSYRSRG